MTDTFAARIAGVFLLASMAAEFGALGIAFSHGSGPASMNAMNWGIGDQLVMFQPSWMRVLFSLAIMAPCLTMLAWPGMYHVLVPGGSLAFYGVIVSSVGFLFGTVSEMIRLSVVITLPAAYVGASDVVKPAVLTMAALVGQLFQILAQTSLLVIFAVGTPLIALAIKRARTLPSWLGSMLLIPSALVGYVGGPLLVLGRPDIGGPFIGLGLNVMFAWSIVTGILLLRWRPSRVDARAGSTAT